MKRLFSIVIAVVLSAAALFTGCKKDDNTVFSTSFFTPQASSKISLYIDGTYSGVLPYFTTEPGCGNQNGDGMLPLSMQLKSGEYKIVGKDVQGKVISSGTMYISKCTNSISGGIGGQSVSNNGSCVVVGLFE